MAETAMKPTANRSAKERRNTLFRVLDGVLSLSHQKIHNGGNSDRAKQGWARVRGIFMFTPFPSPLADQLGPDFKPPQ
jgi:hypothetical protein